MRTLTSEEVNLLVFRYLQESGFKHSAYTFGNEALIHKSKINNSEIPPGCLITFLQKGLQYLEIEQKITSESSSNPDTKIETAFDLLNDYLKKRYGQREKRTLESVKREYGNTSDSMEIDEEKQETNIMREDEVTILKGHKHEVFICAWNPQNPYTLASGSGDSTARIWTLPQGQSGKEASLQASSNSIILKHSSGPSSSKDVTTLDWSGDGLSLATGSYDGKARIWSSEGTLLRTLDKHNGPIFSLKWNKRGDYLLSGSVDNTAIVWDVKTGEVKQQFKHHSAPTLDVDWRTDNVFATCSTDKMIYVCKIGEEKPLRKFVGHEDEVNAIRWDPSGSLLASCSDDRTAKIWNMKNDKCVYDFREHTKEIYTIKWSPTGKNTRNPNKDLILASASFDATIKLWDVNVGKCLYSLTKHSDPVYSVAFSPNGDYLASGSFDRCLHIWSIKDGKLIKTYNGSGSIFEVCWNSTGDKVAACFSNSITEDFSVCVLDFRM